MTFEQLAVFVAAVEQKTFLDAALELHMTQSGVSKQLVRLEKELDVALFDRTGRKAVLTGAGQQFYPEACRLLEAYNGMLKRMAPYRGKNKKQIRMGTLPFFSQYGLTAYVKEFSDKNPDVCIHLMETEEEELITGFDKGSYDCVIGREGMVPSRRHRSRLILEDELVAVISEDYPLKAAVQREVDRLPWETFSGEDFVLMNDYTAIHQTALKMFSRCGVHINIRRTARPDSVLNAVSVGEGISILPKGFVDSCPYKNLKTYTLSPKASVNVLLFTDVKDREDSPCELLADFLEKAVGRRGELF